jgi:hypothetical protein
MEKCHVTMMMSAWLEIIEIELKMSSAIFLIFSSFLQALAWVWQ